MGSGQSISRERLEREKEELHRAREEQLKEALRLEKEKNIYLRAREDAIKAVETQQLQEALRRSNAETQNRLYPSLNPIAGSSTNESYQTNAAPNLVVNHDHFRFPPSAPPAPLAPTACEPPRAPPPRPPTIHKPANETSAVRVPQATTQTFQCPNAADGCRLWFKKSELMTKHEKECPFKELQCPALGNCNWIGKLSQISIHFDEEHPYSRQANVDTEMYLPGICKEQNSVQLIKLGSYNFLFYVKVSEIESRLYMEVQLIGTKISASKWYYEIHVYNKRVPRRKYRFIDSCRSSNETSGISLSSCAVLPLYYAMSFVNEGKFTYKIFIKKEEY